VSFPFVEVRVGLVLSHWGLDELAVDVGLLLEEGLKVGGLFQVDLVFKGLFLLLQQSQSGSMLLMTRIKLELRSHMHGFGRRIFDLLYNLRGQALVVLFIHNSHLHRQLSILPRLVLWEGHYYISLIVADFYFFLESFLISLLFLLKVFLAFLNVLVSPAFRSKAALLVLFLSSMQVIIPMSMRKREVESMNFLFLLLYLLEINGLGLPVPFLIALAVDPTVIAILHVLDGRLVQVDRWQ